MSPQQIAHYRIAAKIGEGGMGAVYRAGDTKLNRDVAIKVLPETFAQDPDRLARFTREAQLLAGLNHPNIAAIYGVEERALILELVEGPTLADRIAHGPIPLDEALPIARQIAEALEYAHEKGVIHRDLKPANIKITPEGRVKVLDFGLAKALTPETAAGDPSSSPTMTMRATAVGIIMGTAGYMSPEQARGKPVDRRADIWAFGVVFFEMLTGRALFDGDTVSDLIAQVLTKEPDLDAAPESLRPLLRRCLERDARKRLRDIGDAFYLIEEKPPAAALPPADPRRRLLPWVLAAAATLCACAFAALWLRNPSLPPPPYRFTLDPTGPIHFSPNGRWMLSVSNGLRLRSLDGVSWKSLPATDGASDAFWSPDSSTIGFFAGGRLRAISLDGTNLRNLAAAPSFATGTWRGSLTDGVILMAAGRQLQTLDLRSGKVNALPLRFSESETPLAPVFTPEGEGFVYLIRSSANGTALFRSTLSSTRPAGERVLETNYAVSFARHPRSGRWQIFYVRTDAGTGLANRALLTAPVDPRTGALAGEPTQVVDAIANWPSTPYARFDVADSGLIYWYRTTPSLPIWRLQWFDRNGNAAGTIGDAAGHTSISLSPDETRLASLQGYPQPHIWIYNLQNGTGSRISSPGSEGIAVWSPDSRFLYYASESEASSKIVRQGSAPGSLPETVWQGPEGRRVSLQDVTPDGRYLILHIINPVGFTTGRAGLHFYRLDLNATSEARQPELLFAEDSGVANPVNARISPDGHSIVFSDGSLIFACRYPPAGEPPREVAALPNQAFPFFSRDGKQLYSISGQALYSHTVMNLPAGGIRLGERSLLFRLAHPARVDINPGAASRDGNRILAISTDQAEEVKIQVLSDWTSLLKL